MSSAGCGRAGSGQATTSVWRSGTRTSWAWRSATPGAVSSLPDPVVAVAAIEAELGPRWVWWDRSTADVVVAGGVAIARCWDVLTVHRLLRGGWKASVPEAWAWLHGLASDSMPVMGNSACSSGGTPTATGANGEPDDPEQPVRADGHLRPEWTSGGWTCVPRTARVGGRSWHSRQRTSSGGGWPPGPIPIVR